MRILITGKNGYVGSSLLTKLSTPDNEVVGISRKNFDLTNRELTNDFFNNEVKFDVIIHTAVKGGSRLKVDGDDVISDNLKMFYNLLSNEDKFDQLINLGTGVELDYPNTPYGLSKNIIWDVIKDHDKLNNVRIFGVFDENEWETRFIKTCLRHYKNKEPIKINQNKQFSFIYMDDLVNIIKYIILNPTVKLIDCCYKDNYTLETIAQYINTLDKHNCEIKIEQTEPGSPYMGKFQDHNIDLIGLKQGIKETYDRTN